MPLATEEIATTESLPENSGADFTSEYLTHQDFEANIFVRFCRFTYPIFQLNMLSSGVAAVKLRPPDQWFT